MVARGRIRNGVVVLESGAPFPEGQEVTVLARGTTTPQSHSILDIGPVSLGAVLRPLLAGDDLLGEMLDARR